MISSEVQRTLVKSPPELWAEISDPESLARHLGEFGEIRITHVKPEQKVEWEADTASGTVVIKPSGWGTKVKLTVTRELAEREPAAGGAVQADAEPDDEQPSADAPEQAADEPAQDIELERDATCIAAADKPHEAVELADDELESNADDAATVGPALESSSEFDPRAEPHEASEPHGEAERPDEAETRAEAEPPAQPEPEPEPRRGFFARLFGRRRARSEEPSRDAPAEPAPSASEPIDDEQLSDGLTMQERDFELAEEPAHEHETVPSAAADELSETVAQSPGELAPQRETQAAEQTLDGRENAAVESAEQIAPDDPSTTHTKLAEELAEEEVTAVLTGVLDRLGSAHHRPFSRA
jgi:hypothetical protein